jgi:predicted  nucleic acid-binding Zn-ribbon protein
MQPHITDTSEKDTTLFPQDSEGDEAYPEVPSISHSSAEQDSYEKQHSNTAQCSLATGPSGNSKIQPTISDADDPLTKILAVMHANKTEIMNFMNKNKRKGNTIVTNTINEVRNKLASNKETLNQVAEKLNQKLESSMAAVKEMTRDVARSPGARASEIEKDIQEVRSGVAAAVGNLSSEVDQLRKISD